MDKQTVEPLEQVEPLVLFPCKMDFGILRNS